MHLEIRKELKRVADKTAMLKIFYKVRENRKQRLLKYLLSHYKTPEDLFSYAEKIGYHGLIQYEPSLERQKKFIYLFDFFTFDFNSKSFFDLGPGYGDTLEIARSRGAITVEFADYDPYIFAFNALKGFKGYFLNYTIEKGLSVLPDARYDFILSKGSINADLFNRKPPGMIPFPVWLDHVERLARREALIVICPTFDRGSKSLSGSYYLCEDTEAFRCSWFSCVLLSRGYEISVIKGFNEPIERFPFTFHKKLCES